MTEQNVPNSVEQNGPKTKLVSNSIFWIDVDKINPNPYQPRREFEEIKLKDLADSIRMYGVLQPLVVSRIEHETSDGGLVTEYELIAGERRLRASRLAGLAQVPVVIRVGDDSLTKLELAIIENLQREDLNPVERARAFQKLADQFGFTHAQVGQKVGKSREYVSNTIRILMLSDEILNALSEGKISEGHTRPLMMLSDKPEEQMVLFKEIVCKKTTVREAERIARKVAHERARKRDNEVDPEILTLEEALRSALGTRVHIERHSVGGQIMIDFFTDEDLKTLMGVLQKQAGKLSPTDMLDKYLNDVKPDPVITVADVLQKNQETATSTTEDMSVPPTAEEVEKELNEVPELLDDRSVEEVRKAEEDTDDLYDLTKFSI